MMWLGLRQAYPNPNPPPQFLYYATASLLGTVVDSNDNVYVSGMVWVDTTGMPIVDSVQSSLGTATQCNGSTWAGSQACSGLYIAKFDPHLDAPVFSTVYGPVGGSALGVPQSSQGSMVEFGSIAVDSDGNVYAVGFTGASNWPTTSGAFQPDYASGFEGFLLKLTDVPASSDVLLTTDHLFFPGSLFNGYSWTPPNNYNSPTTQTVTVVNDSSSPLQIASIVANNSKTNPLSASQNCVGEVAARSSCAITVTFNPQRPGDLAGTITVTDNSSNSPHVITGIGSGFMGEGQPASTSLNFLPTPLGQTVTQTMLFSNTGNLPLNVSSIVATGAFSESDNCAGGISPQNACAIYVSFTPAQAKNYMGTLSITDDGPASPHVVKLTGSGPAPAAVLSTASLSFGSEIIGSTTTAQTVTLTNPGQDSLTFTSIAASGDFAQTNNCLGGVKVGSKCTIAVKFTPTASGARTGELTIKDNANGSPQTVSLGGTGLAVSLSTDSLTFGSRDLGSTGLKDVTLTNKGKTALSLTGTGLGISITGTDESSFSQTNTCGASVAGGASCTITVTFKPVTTGTLTAAVRVGENTTGSPQKIALTGKGVGPIVSLSHASLTFASTPVGTAAAKQTVTLTNTGNATLGLAGTGAGRGIGITGADSSSYSETHTCGSAVDAGAKCTITVTFKPAAKGTLTADITITDNAYPAAQTVKLSGTGN